MRVLHCPSNTAGNSWGLSQAERKLGLVSDTMILRQNWLDYPMDINLHLDRRSPVLSAIRLTNFFVNALTKYDVFHFDFGESMMPMGVLPQAFDYFDVRILNTLGKKIVATYHGCDARQSDYTIDHFDICSCKESSCREVGLCNRQLNIKKRRNIKKLGQYAKRIFALNPDLLYVLPKQTEFCPYASVDLSYWVPVPQKLNKKLVIIHSPTNRGGKGSGYIIQAVVKLSTKYNVELKLVEGIPHDQVKAIYSSTDICIDQLLTGWYGAFAVEMMALGKPVVSYIREEDLKFIPPQMKDDMPIINANPNTIYEVLDRLLQERDKLPLIGEQRASLCRKVARPNEDSGTNERNI